MKLKETLFADNDEVSEKRLTGLLDTDDFRNKIDNVVFSYV